MASLPGSSAAPPAAPPPGQQAEEAVGAEFFRRRFQRAAAIPPEQRDPAVHAFVTSVQLLNAADELLPLTADGQPALPADTLAGQEAEVQAMLLTAAATYAAPEQAEWEGQQQKRLACYMRCRLGLAAGGLERAYLPALQPLARVLLMVTVMKPVAGLVQKVQDWASALAELELDRATISQQLQQAQRGSSYPLLTAEQLEAKLCYNMAAHGVNVLAGLGSSRPSPLSTATLSATAAATLACSERLLVLEPNNPKMMMTAIADFMACPAQTPQSVGGQAQPDPAAGTEQLTQRILDLYIRTFHAAQAQHSLYWTVAAAGQALLLAAVPSLVIRHGDLAALVTAGEAAPAAVKQLRRALPHSLAVAFDGNITAVCSALPVARLRLRGSSGAASEWQACTTMLHALSRQDDNVENACICSGCGKTALGLQRCSRCKQAAYCSRECQVRHWPQHKRECAQLVSTTTTTPE